MGLVLRLIQTLTVCMLALLLAFAPVMVAVTHGPGALAAESDHAAWHAEQAGLSPAEEHQHHDVTDHDHSPSFILGSHDTQALVFRSVVERNGLPFIFSAVHDGPRRPPRSGDPIA